MFKFLYNKPFWLHLILALGVLFLILFLFVLSLNWITKHGESSSVPVVTGKSLSEAKAILQKKSFDLVVQDSVYYDSLPPGQILKQVPEADEVIKINRTVFVTANSYVPPDVDMPNIKGYSFKNAEMILKNLGLKIGDTTFRPDFAPNTILEVSFKGNPVAPGTKVKMGSKIDLVLSGGVGDEAITVPDLVGKTWSDARALLDAQGLIYLTVPNPDVRDTAAAFVYQQRPAPRTVDGRRLTIRQGQMIDVRLQVEKPVIDSTNANPPSPQTPEEP